MNIIWFSRAAGEARQLNLAHPVSLGLIGALVLGILSTAFALGMQLGQHSGRALVQVDTGGLASAMSQEKRQIADVRRQLQERVDALAMRLGEDGALEPLTEERGFIADIHAKTFAPAPAKFNANVTSAWLPSERVARAWVAVETGKPIEP